jgi:protoporphyrinogen oxidase/glycosyltransferase involved in cell wall biosynthesis
LRAQRIEAHSRLRCKPRFPPTRAVIVNELVVFSHRRWDVVYRRPQQILSRLARTWRVLFIEQPLYSAGDPRAELFTPAPGVTVLRPHTPLTAPGFHDDQIPLLTRLIGQAIARERFTDYGAWLYTPMALPLLTKLAPRIIVYDCMDEQTAAREAPRQLVQRENALMRVANAVFAAGPSLYEARRARHRNVHLFTSSVDGDHFARGGDVALTHPDVKTLARPRLGFFGVLDERLDLALLRDVAVTRPEWELCIVGPVQTIDPASLPRLPNVHYFGQRSYDELPAFLAGWDIAMLPFAHGDATRFVSPTKTLEYMAAGRAIVSTTAGDLQRLYGGVVRFADTPAQFVRACEAALVEPAASRGERLAAMRGIVSSTSWDETARGMRRVIESVASRGLTEAARTMLAPANLRKVTPAQPASPTSAPCVVLGAGPTGLSAAYHYGEGSIVLEREAKVGGGCRSIEDTGFTFDHAGHVMLSDDPCVQDLYRLLLGDNVHWQACSAWICSKGVLTRYPDAGSPQGAAARDDAPRTLEELPDPEETIEGALPPLPKPMRPDARFGYPLRGGFQALMNGFLPLLRGEVLLDADVERVSPLLRTVTLADGRRFHYDTLISTLPLPVLIAAMGDEAPREVRRAARELRHVSGRCVNLGVARPHVSDRHWIHFPADTVFHRVFLQGNASPHCNPPGGFGLTCEIAYSATKPLPAVGAALIERCVADCVRVGLLQASDALLTSNEIDMPYAYVIDDHGRRQRVALIREWLAHFDIILAGRYSEWEQYDADHAFVAGRNAAQVAQLLATTRVTAKTA